MHGRLLRVALREGCLRARCAKRKGGNPAKLAAFTLGEQINDEIAVIHIEKADSGIPGLYTIINQQFVEHAWTKVKYINREEDMGLEGLRRAKLSYNPAFMIDKFHGRLA